eukprot:6212757-Pleurochrysis_carterae.AAC.1
MRRGRKVESISSRTLHNKRASCRLASGVTGLSCHFATPRSSVSGTQYAPCAMRPRPFWPYLGWPPATEALPGSHRATRACALWQHQHCCR